MKKVCIGERSGDILFFQCFLSYSFLYIGRKAYSLSMSLIVGEGILNLVQAGAVGTVFLVCYAAGQIINGILGDALRPQLLIKLGTVGSGMATMLLGLASRPIHFMVIWALNGIFCSMCWAPSIKFIALSQKEDKVVPRASAMILAVPLGTVGSYLVNGLILASNRWRAAFFASSALILLAGIADIFILNLGETSSRPEAPEPPKANSGILAGTGLVLLAVAVFFNGIIKDGLDLWLQALLSGVFGLSASSATLLSIFLPIVSISGVFFAKLILDKRFDNEMRACSFMFLISTVAMALFLIIAWRFSGSLRIPAVLVSVLLISIAMAMSLGINNVIVTLIPVKYMALNRTSTLSGLFNAISYVSAGIAGSLVGMISGRFSWTAVILYFLFSAFAGCLFAIVSSRSYARGKARLCDVLSSVKLNANRHAEE